MDHDSQIVRANKNLNQIKVTHYDKTKKMAHDSQIVRANINLKLSYGWPSQRKISGINKRIKALRQERHWVWGLTQRRQLKRKQ